MTATCETVRPWLLVPDGARDVAAESHIANCAACAAFARSIERVDALAASVLRVEAPAQLRARLAELPRLARAATLVAVPDVGVAAVAFGRADVRRPSDGHARAEFGSAWSSDPAPGIWIVAATLVALAVGRAITLASDLSAFVGDLSLAFTVLAATIGAEVAGSLDLYLGSLGIWLVVGVIAWIAGGGILRLPYAASAVAGPRV